MRIPASLGFVRENLADALNHLLGRRRDLVPPRRLSRLAGARGDFVEVGEELARLAIEHGELAPGDRVLDVGCGAGRLAVPLTRYLAPSGSYDGIDVMAGAIRWCRRHISSRFGHFRFHHADLRNGVYNPRGGSAASDFVFPFEDGAFDVAVLTSVFTHLPGPEFDHYVGELARVLRPGGRLVATYFLLNAESERLIREGRTLRAFGHDFGSYRTETRDKPEQTVAFLEDHVRERYSASELAIREPILYGKWCGRARYLTFQDLLVAVRRPAAGGPPGEPA